MKLLRLQHAFYDDAERVRLAGRNEENSHQNIDWKAVLRFGACRLDNGLCCSTENLSSNYIGKNAVSSRGHRCSAPAAI